MTETAEQDHIDRWLEEIHDQLPRLDLRVEGIVDRIGGINRRIKRMLDETLEEYGLSSGEWHALGSLSRAPDGRAHRRRARFEDGAVERRDDEPARPPREGGARAAHSRTSETGGRCRSR